MENVNDNSLLVCKACGYKIKSRNLKTVCPACGVDKKFFVPFTDNISQVRRKVLELHLHPVVVHFSVAISIILFLTILVSFFTGGKVSEALKGTSVVISIVLPFFVAAGFVSGIIDGIARFKKVKRPALLKKIYLSIGFLIFSVAVPVILGLLSFDVLYIKVVLLVLCFFSAIFGTILGKLGGHLTEAILLGK
jgi:hypothetical protein